MTILYIALPVALLLAIAAVAAFIWSASSGQLDDLETPPVRMLYDNEPRQVNKTDDQQGDRPE